MTQAGMPSCIVGTVRAHRMPKNKTLSLSVGGFVVFGSWVQRRTPIPLAYPNEVTEMPRPPIEIVAEQGPELPTVRGGFRVYHSRPSGTPSP